MDIFHRIDQNWPVYVILVCAYLLGSIPFGLVITRLSGLGDIRQIGSGNIGATNVLRTGKRSLALATLLLDGGKGTFAVVICQIFYEDAETLSMGAGFAALIGHVYPVWLKFKGGKGVATALGVMLGISFYVGISAAITWLMTAWIFGYSSLAALMAIDTAPICAYLLKQPNVTLFTALIAIVITLTHRENIRRLLRGTEPKIRLTARPPGTVDLTPMRPSSEYIASLNKKK